MKVVYDCGKYKVEKYNQTFCPKRGDLISLKDTPFEVIDAIYNVEEDTIYAYLKEI